MDKDRLIEALTREGNLCFPANKRMADILREPLTGLKNVTQDGATLWFEGDKPSPATIRIKIYPTGHVVFYNTFGRRFLMTDPEGHPLHEAEWEADPATHEIKLKQARCQLDCQQWVGIKPKAKKFSTHISIKGQPGWETMSLDRLREGAAQAWQVPHSEVEYFYKDENFVSTAEGEYDVNLYKDGLYALPGGTFETPVFVSFMFGVQWEKLDLIPVVELFQSTLPGSGGAVFEFIWGLFEDQSRETPLPPLRYRGLPTYPSKEAFNIFSAFFTPKGPASEDIMEVFMDTDRSHEIEWTPRHDPPWRYFSTVQSMSLTVQDGYLYKLTLYDDPIGIPYINTARGGFGSCQRYMSVTDGQIILHDAAEQQKVPIAEQWQVTDQTPAKAPPSAPFGWQHFFGGNAPETDPVKILYTVPFYPEGEALIDEASLQPMVLDQIFHYMESHDDMEDKLEAVDSVLVHTFDSVISGCVDCTHDREVTVLYGDPEFAVKNAQQLWNFAAGRKQLDNLKRVKFLSEAEHVDEAYQKTYSMIYKWIPFVFHQNREAAEAMLKSLADALKPGGMLFLCGPGPIRGLFEHYGLSDRNFDPVTEMPFFNQHRKMCPENQVHPEITVFLTEKR
jgi:hypothetical protein